MNKNWMRSINFFRRRYEQDVENLKTFLETLPQAAVYIQSNDQRILLANDKATELFNQPKHTIERSYLNELVINLSKLEGKPELISPGVYIGNFHPNSNPLIDENVQLFVTALEQQKYLILIQPLDGLPQNKNQHHLIESLLESLAEMVIQPSKDDGEPTYQPVLQWITDLVRAQAAVLYLANEGIPSFRLIECYGEFDGLPSELSSQDMKVFQSAFVWETGRKSLPVSNLTNTILGNQPSYFATIPVGQTKAIIGILIIIGGRHPPPSFTRHAGIFAANLIHQSIENYSQQSVLISQANSLMESKITQEISEKFIQEGILSLSSDSLIRNINPAVEKIFGYSRNEIINQPVENIIIGNERFDLNTRQIIRQATYQNLMNVALFRRNGEMFLANIHLVPESSGIQTDSIVMIIEDLSEKERIRVQTEQLEQRAYVGEVTAVFAHEVRNPVNNISTGLQLLARNLPKDDPNQPEITRLLQDCDRLVDLMKSVLSISRPLDYRMQPLDIGELINRLINRRIARLQNAGIAVEIKIQPGTPKVMGDIRGLEQVFTNLINNAIQAMSDTGGNLIIKTQTVSLIPEQNDNFEEQSHVEVSIADTGPGIPIEIQEIIFQPFFTTRSTGTGLGLTIVKRIVNLHKGNIRLESFPGGTIFYVSLPSVDSKPSKSPQLSPKQL